MKQQQRHDQDKNRGKIDWQAYRLADNLTIPNIISIIRLLMIPFILYTYYRGHSHLAVALVIISFVSDVVDGYIARHFHQVTPLGKMLDPFADKLTQIALAVIICLNHRQLIPVAIILTLKEGAMMVLGLRLLRSGGEPFSALWWGKLSTGVFYLGVVVLIFFEQELSSAWFWGISGVISLCLINSILLYLREYWRMAQQRQERQG